jgi:hypothetical protein
MSNTMAIIDSWALTEIFFSAWGFKSIFSCDYDVFNEY